jgi:hypothetical protein
MIHRKISMAFEKWQYEAACMKAEKFALGGVIRRLINRKLSMAWEQWQQVCAELRHQKFLMGGAVRRMVFRKMSQAWEQWQWFRQHMIDQAASEAAMRRAAAGFINKAKKQALNGWLFWYETVMLQKAAMRRALVKMIHR